jgi:hypothetical protein
MLDSKCALTRWLTTWICMCSASVKTSLDPVVLWIVPQVVQSWQHMIRPFLKSKHLATTRLGGRNLRLLHSLMGSVLSQPAANHLNHSLLQPSRAHLCPAADSISVTCLQCVNSMMLVSQPEKNLFLISSGAGQHLSVTQEE